jgi:hypothetical protein
MPSVTVSPARSPSLPPLCWPRGRRSPEHDSAAALWRLGPWPQRQEVTALQQRRRPGIRTHRSTTLTPDDVTVHYGIPVTTPVRTICDIAPRPTDDELLEAVDDARASTYLGPTSPEELIDRCPRLRRLVGPASGPTRSKLERAFKRFAKTYDLPPYRLHRILRNQR